MLPDDVFRDRLEQTLVEIEAWARKTRDCATIDVGASQQYWRHAGSSPFPQRPVRSS